VRNQQRPRYGYYVDHALDIPGTAFLFDGLALGGLMTPGLAMARLATYLVMMAEVFLATNARGVFKMSFLGFGPTQLFDVGAIVGMAGMAWAFLASSIANARALYAEEPIER